MAKPLVSDELWAIIEPLLPSKPAHPKGGRPFTVSDRAALAGIIFVLKTGIQWEYLPQEMGSGCGMTCWRRLRAWQRAGVWRAAAPGAPAAPGRRRQDRLAPGQRRRGAGAGKGGGEATGPNPVDRAKPGAHHHLVADRPGARSRAFSTAANVNEGTVLARLVDAIPPLRQPHGRPGPPPPAGQAARRQGLRLAGEPRPAAALPHRPAHRPQGHRVPARAWGGGAGSPSATWPGSTATAACWSATSAPRAPRRLPRPRLRPHLLAIPPAAMGWVRHS